MLVILYRSLIDPSILVIAVDKSTTKLHKSFNEASYPLPTSTQFNELSAYQIVSVLLSNTCIPAYLYTDISGSNLPAVGTYLMSKGKSVFNENWSIINIAISYILFFFIYILKISLNIETSGVKLIQ